MAFNPTGSVIDNKLGTYLKIVSQNGVYNNLSENSAAWKYVLKRKKGPEEGRELRYGLRSAYGSASAQFLAVSGAVLYPDAHQSTLVEGITQFKDFGCTIEVERTLIQKALSDASRFGEPLAEEMKCKTIALARILSAALYQDGTGRIGQVASTAVVGGELVVALATGSADIGHVGWFEFGDRLKSYDTAGAVQVPTVASGTHAYFGVINIDRVNDTVTLASYDAGHAKLTINAANQVSAGDFLCRIGITPNDWAAIGTTNDYGSVSESFVGLGSLVAADGRKVNNINMNAPIRGTRVNANGAPIDSSHFQQLMSLVKVAVGEGTYNWSSALMAPEVLDALVESRETDVRFTNIKDVMRGCDSLGYMHGKSKIMFESDEFCPKTRVYVIPEGDCLQFKGSDFEYVQPEGGNKFFLRPSAGGHYRQIRAYMEGSGTLFCVHPQAIGVLEGFVR